MTFHFCTCFDSNYLIYGYTLYRSLKTTGIEFKLYVACLDDTVFQNLQTLRHPEIIPIPLSDIEQGEPEPCGVHLHFESGIASVYFAEVPGN